LDKIFDDCFLFLIDYLEKLNKKTFLTIELGLQTIHESTTNLINRCHDLKCFDDIVKKLQKRNIFVVAHVINGLPFETKEMMIDTIKHLNDINIDGVKIHMLSILKETPLEKMYLDKPFHLLSESEYVDIVCDQLEYLKPEIVIQRLTGDPMASDLIGPDWLVKKVQVLNDIDKEMVKRNSYQGKNVDY